MPDIKHENSIQKDAFEFYYSLGDQRSLKAVSQHFHRSLKTVANWSKDFNWVDRVTQRQLDEAGEKEKENILLDVKLKYRKFFDSLISVAMKDFQEGKLKIKNIQDLERVIKLDLALMDSSIDTINVTGGLTLTTEDKKAMDELLKEMKSEFANLRK